MLIIYFFVIYFVLNPVNNVIAGKRNILFFIIDDLKPALKSFGDLNAHTPNIDSLAAKSFIFKKAYAQQALCAPSRNSFLTSRRPDSLHLYDVHNYWRTFVGNFTTIPQYFKENGYYTYSIGKVFHPGKSSNFTDDFPISWSKKPFHPKTDIFKNAKVCVNSDGTFGSNLICPVNVEFQPLQTLPDLEIYEETLGFLENRRNEPYFLTVGFHKPHIPFKFPKEYLKYHPIERISLPTNKWRSTLLPDVAYNPWMDIRDRDDIRKLNLMFPFGVMPDDVAKKIIQSYYSSVTYIDDLIGRILQKVDLNNTIIVLTGDHGWSLGQHGEYAKYSNFQEATRVPLIIYSPDLVTNNGVTSNNFAELVDLFPTLVELSNNASNSLKKCSESTTEILCTEGKSLLHSMRQALKNNGKKIKTKSAIFTQYPRPGSQITVKPNFDQPKLEDIRVMGYSITTKRYRYCEWIKFNNTNFNVDWNTTYGVELYDLLIDSQENLNLYDRSEFKNVISRLKVKLHNGWRAFK